MALPPLEAVVQSTAQLLCEEVSHGLRLREIELLPRLGLHRLRLCVGHSLLGGFPSSLPVGGDVRGGVVVQCTKESVLQWGTPSATAAR